MGDIQKTILQIMRDRTWFNKLHGMIAHDDLDTDTAGILRDYVVFFKKNPDIDMITGDLYIAMKDLAGEYTTDGERELDRTLFEELQKTPNPEVIKSIARHIITLKYTNSVEKILMKGKLGNEPDVFGAVRSINEQFKKQLGTGKEQGPLEMSLEEIFEDHDTGLVFPWKLGPLNDAMENVRTGNMVIIAARPDTGKTSFVADQVTYMAQATKEITERPILWLNNEGKGSGIQLTAFRSALNLTYNELRQFGGSKAQTAIDAYMGGTKRLRIYDVHGMHYTELESIIEEEQPCIVVVDMLDNVKGFEHESRTDLRLEQLYIWLRESAVINDFLALPTSQVSKDGEDEAFPDMSMLKDSKTGKQGACDGIVIIGKKNDPKLVNTRYISCPKNKFSQKPGSPKLCLANVYFDYERARYHNPVGYDDGSDKGEVYSG